MTTAAEFTPRPWIVGDLSPMDGTQIKGENGYYIGEVYNVSEKPENLANAQLIAAAPDLYAEASAALACLLDQCGLAEDCELIVGLRAAVAKAEGRAA